MFTLLVTWWKNQIFQLVGKSLGEVRTGLGSTHSLPSTPFEPKNLPNIGHQQIFFSIFDFAFFRGALILGALILPGPPPPPPY